MTWFDSNRLQGNSIKSLAPDPFAPSFPFGGHPEGYIERIERESKETAEMFARQQEDIKKKYKSFHEPHVSRYHQHASNPKVVETKEEKEPIPHQEKFVHNYDQSIGSAWINNIIAEKNNRNKYKHLRPAAFQSGNNERRKYERRKLFYENASECFAIKAKETAEKYEKYTQVTSIRKQFDEELESIYFRAMDFIKKQNPPERPSDFENYLTSASINLIEKPIDKFFRGFRINYIKFLFNKYFK